MVRFGHEEPDDSDSSNEDEELENVQEGEEKDPE